MKKIYCFVEEENGKTEEFLESWQEEDIIIYMPGVIESCEGKLFFALGELISQFLREEAPVIFATDIRELYDAVMELFAPYLEKLVYLGDVPNSFTEKADLSALLDFEERLLMGSETRLLLHRYRKLSGTKDLQRIFDVTVEIYSENEGKGWGSKAFWAQISRIYSQLMKENGYQASDSFKLLNLSLQMKLEKDAACTNRYLRAVWEWKADDANVYYYIWNQFKAFRLRKLVAMDEESMELLNQMYKRAWEIYSAQIQKKLSVIPKTERKRERVLVLTIQYLLPGHAPTNTVMERCKALLEMGKEVYLVNTAELYTVRGYVPLLGVCVPNVLPQHYNKTKMEIGEFSVPFMQLSEEKTVRERAVILAAVIREFKPWYILSIGSGSMVADLCGSMVPCASMALAFSTLPHTMNEMKLLGRRLSPEEKRSTETDTVIEGNFTFELKEQRGHFARSEMGLPEDKFLLVVVGIRLDYEISEEFLHMLEHVIEKQGNCSVVFAGIYDGFSNMLENHPKLEGHVHFIGYCEDILALMEICDLYVNPKRLGGGFSVIEAFSKGVPGVYLQTGDVYVAGGEEFAAADFEKMEEQIIHYQEDRHYYQEMSVKAKERAALMTSGIEAMREFDTKICTMVEDRFW